VAAVIRETREETAWKFLPRALVGTYLWRNPLNGRSFLRFAFCGEVEDHRPDQPLDHGIERTLWLSPAELAARLPRLRSPLVMRCIDDFLLGRLQPLDTVACLDLESAMRAPSVVNL
jgi:8-oxo-dGTP pyrophosphatase MutT (NUDIX family)